MTTYQVWKQEGTIEGAMKKARLVVLRGRWEGATTRFLANISELPYPEVENLIKGYDKVYELWKTKTKTAHTPIPFLSDEEVKYLMDLFKKDKDTN